MADPYVYDGTSVLRNKFGVRDAAALRELEYDATMNAAGEMPEFPATPAGFKGIHRQLFGSVYDWAGETRTVDMSKGSTVFARAAFIDAALDREFRDLGKRNQLQGLGAAEFAAGAAHHISELNAIHPFREGNGRTMRVHLKQLARRAGLELDASRLPGRDWIAASIAGMAGDEVPMARVIGGAMSLGRQAALSIATPIDDALSQLYDAIGPAQREASILWRDTGKAARQNPMPPDIAQRLAGAQRLVSELADPQQVASDLVLLRAAKVPTIALPQVFAGALERVTGIRAAASKAVADLPRDLVREAKIALKPRGRGLE